MVGEYALPTWIRPRTHPENPRIVTDCVSSPVIFIAQSRKIMSREEPARKAIWKNMPIHDWTRVDAGIFHHFHHAWIFALSDALNGGILPPNHYALAEQLAGGYGPDVLTLEAPTHLAEGPPDDSRGGIALAEVLPKVSYRARAEADVYAAKANRVAVRHVSDHRVVAVVEIVSPGNKSTLGAFRTFVEKAAALLRGGVHLMAIDLFPPTPRDPQGIHKGIWDELDACNFVLPPDRFLTIASYIGGVCQEAFVEPVAVGRPLPDMPLFLKSDLYVQVPLEETYRSAWKALPAVWRNVLEFSPGERPANSP
ncbi:MAG: hypothetical protein JWL69_3715 [Phycisphaerales bacterium]|nr:hypothetical protein [Phycisphaerales bacterium]MDB5354973.1 hypothetical protein [Phycisphaerales bacterium]